MFFKQNLNTNSIVSIVKREPSDEQNEDNAEEDRHLSINLENKDNMSFDCHSNSNQNSDHILEESEDKYLIPNDETNDQTMSFGYDNTEEEYNKNNDKDGCSDRRRN